MDSQSNPIISTTIPCPNAKKGAVIGPRGTTVQAIQTQSSTRITVSNTTPTITISGTASSIALAQSLLDTLLHPPTLTFTCPTKHMGKLIGPGGTTLRSLQTQTGTHIVVDNRVDNPPHGPCTITVTGPTLSKCRQAESLVQQLLQPPAIHVECHRLELLGALIGPRGSNIRRLQQETGAHIDVETNRTTATVPVTITGPTLECREAALAKVLAIIQPPPPHDERVLTFQTEKVQHRLGRLIGPSGSTLKRLQSSTHTRIQVDGGDKKRHHTGNNASRTVKVHVSSIEGEYSEVDRAIRVIEGWLLPMTVELTAPKDIASAIIGDNGDNIKRIQEHCQNCVMEKEEEEQEEQEERYASKCNEHRLGSSRHDREASSKCSDQTGSSFATKFETVVEPAEEPAVEPAVETAVETKVAQTTRSRSRKKKRKWAKHDPFQAYIEVTVLGVRKKNTWASSECIVLQWSVFVVRLLHAVLTMIEKRLCPGC